MRPNLADEVTVTPTGKTLILGHPSVAVTLAEALENEGYTPILWKDLGFSNCPDPWQPDAIRELKAAFMKIPKLAYVHPGNSAWADRPELPTVGRELGLTILSPPSRVLSLFLNKLNLISYADQLEIPHLVLKFDPIHTIRELERVLKDPEFSKKSRFPLVLKATRSSGGGGFGIFVMRGWGDLDQRLPLWFDQLRKNFGEVLLFIERYLDSARHIVKPFARFTDGRFQEFQLVDVSLQQRHRKLLEVCPAPSVDGEVAQSLSEWTHKLADQLGYVGVGSFEFLVDGSRAYFIDGSARLSTGYHLWEKVSGTSALSWQLATLNPKGFVEAPKPEREWAVGVSLKIYAEDSVYQLPQPGRIEEVSEQKQFRLPGVVGELIWAVKPKDLISSDSDPLLGVLQAGASDFPQCFHAAGRILEQTWVSGTLQTNERFLYELVEHPWVSNGMFHASFIEEDFVPNPILPELVISSALLFAKQCLPKINQWVIGERVFKVEQYTQDLKESVEILNQRENQFYSGKVGHHKIAMSLLQTFSDSEQWRVRIGNWWLKLRRANLKPVTEQGTRFVRSLVSGRIHAILYQKGSVVPAHNYFVIIESLGVLVPHAIPFSARLLKWTVDAEDEVSEGQILAEVQLEQSSGK